MKRLIFTGLLSFTSSLTFSQGLTLDSAAYDALPKWEAEEQGFTYTTLPSRVSYANYAPYVGNQGQVSTCTGWAVAYGQLTTQQNLLMGITNIHQRSWRAMDPHFVYAFIRDKSDQWCQQGSSMADAMNVLNMFGCKPQVWQPYLTCNSTLVTDETVLTEASFYKIGQWYGLKMESEPISAVKQALAAKHIVSVGMMLTESFQKGATVFSGKWSPKYGEQYIGAHAMCVVGYDDYKYGGSFQILNSYGPEFGDNGYVWVTYSDFAKTMGQAFIFDTPGFNSGGCMYGDCRNSFSIYKTTNGGLYEGVVENGYPGIFGQYIYPDGSMYVGAWNQGRKNGYGLIYDFNSGKYYNVAYKNDVLINSEALGFGSEEDAQQIEDIYNKLSEIVPGELKDEDSEEYKKFADNYEVPLDPIQFDDMEKEEVSPSPEIEKIEEKSTKKRKRRKKKRD